MYYRFKSAIMAFVWLGFLVLAFGMGQPLLAQEPPQDDIPVAPKLVRSDELYRLRVDNSLYGSVMLSMDGGRHYTLVGRVTHPATSVSVDRSASAPGTVLRSSGEGVAFAVNLGQTLRLRPTPPPSAPLLRIPGNGRSNAASAPDPAAILSNIAPRAGLFAFQDLPLPRGTQVRLENEQGKLQPFPTLFTPLPGDTYVFLVSAKEIQQNLQQNVQPESQQDMPQVTPDVPLDPNGPQRFSVEAIRAAITAMGESYLQESVARAKQENRSLIDGTLRLKTKLPQGEPDPIVFVTYSIDGHIVASQNVSPFEMEWDTRQATDGEHVIEVRAYNQRVQLITMKRTLVTVWNRH